MYDADDHPVFENLVDNPEFATPCRVSALKLIAQRLTYPMGIVRQWASNELPARDRVNLRKHISQSPLRGSGEFDTIGHYRNRPAARISSVTSSSVKTSPRSDSASAARTSRIKSWSLRMSSVSMIES